MSNVKQADSVVDISYLKQVSGGDTSLMMDMIDLFLGQTPLQISQMYQCVDDENWQALNRIAHKAKSSFGVMGVESIVEDIKHVEIWASQQIRLDEITPLIDNINRVCQQAYTEYERIMEQM
ncbi:MAG: Hpt domain-containing protein [Bacteroidota bacterium]